MKAPSLFPPLRLRVTKRNRNSSSSPFSLPSFFSSKTPFFSRTYREVYGISGFFPPPPSPPPQLDETIRLLLEGKHRHLPGFPYAYIAGNIEDVPFSLSSFLSLPPMIEEVFTTTRPCHLSFSPPPLLPSHPPLFPFSIISNPCSVM